MPKAPTEFFEIAWKKRTGINPVLDDPSYKLACATLSIAERFAGILRKDVRSYDIVIITKPLRRLAFYD